MATTPSKAASPQAPGAPAARSASSPSRAATPSPAPAAKPSAAADASRDPQAAIEAQVATGKLPEAQAAARAWLHRTPDDPRAALALAWVLIETSRSPAPAGAAADLSEPGRLIEGVLAQRPGLLRARLLKGMLLARQGKNDQALMELAAVREAMLRPADLALLANGYKALSALDDEAQVLEAMVPGYPWPATELMFRRARVLIHQHRDPEAIALLRELQKQGGDDARTRFHIGRAMEEGGDFEGARVAYKATLETKGPAEFLEKAQRRLADKTLGAPGGALPAASGPPGGR